MIAARVLILALLPLLSSAYVHGNYYDMRVQICNGSPSLHGLWPQWAESCQASSFDVNSLSSIMSQMEQYWPSCAGSMSNSQFWQHEWEKHGSCSGMSQLQYFTTVLNLFQQYGLTVTQETDICFTKSLTQEPCPTSNSYSDGDSSYSDGDSDSSYMNDSQHRNGDNEHVLEGVIGAIVVAGAVVLVVALAVRAYRRRGASMKPQPLEEGITAL